MIVITVFHSMNADVCRTLRGRTMRIKGKYYEFIGDIGSDVKLNFDVISYAIKHTVFCMAEITLKLSSATRAIMLRICLLAFQSVNQYISRKLITWCSNLF